MPVEYLSKLVSSWVVFMIRAISLLCFAMELHENLSITTLYENPSLCLRILSQTQWSVWYLINHHLVITLASWLKCTIWARYLSVLFPVPNLSFSLLCPSMCLPPPLLLLLIHFLAVSWGVETNEGWLRLLWLLQRRWLHGWLQRRLWTVVPSAACTPWRWPHFQQCSYVLRVSMTTRKKICKNCSYGVNTVMGII